MMELSIASFFAVGLGYGMLHALDPDHVAAVSGMSAQPKRPLWRQAFQWSLGHGGALIIIAGLVMLAGMAIPHTFSEYAESLVAYMLIAIGLLGYWRVYLAFNHAKNIDLTSKSGAPFVGMLHGFAGSAPLLTLIPLSKIQEPIVGLVYVVLFCVGVSIAMLGFGGLMMQGAKLFTKMGRGWHQAFHFVLASFALLFGVYLLFTR